jgi:putative MATE family efflux protein
VARRPRLDERDRRIIALAVPALGTLAIEPVYVLVDTAIVGHLGTSPLGGLALASTVLSALTTVCNFLSFGTTSRVAFLIGRRDRVGAAGVGVQSLWVALLVGAPLAVAVATLARPLAGVLGGSGGVLDAATTYLRISALSVPAVLVALAGNGWFRGRADTRTPLRIVLVANLLNVVLEVVLVYGVHLGVAGSAWGTVVAQWCAAGWFLVLVGSDVLASGVTLHPRWAEIGRLLVVARQIFVRTAALLAVLTLATAVAARVDAVTLAGHQIAVQVFLFLALVLDSLAIPAQTFVGLHLGAGEREEASAVSRAAIRLSLYAGALVGVALLALALPLPYVFTSDGQVAGRASAALAVVAVMQVPGSVAFVLDGVLMGRSDFGFLQWSMLAGLVVFLPFAAVVLVHHDVGILGIWGGLLAWMCGRAAANAVRASRHA